MILATVGHRVCKLHVVVDSLVDLKPDQYGIEYHMIGHCLTASMPYVLWRANSG